MTVETEKKTDEPKKRKRYRRPKTKLSYGPRGLETLRLCFQVGGVTPQQHARFFDVRVKYSYRLLSSLAEQRLLESAPVMTAGRPRGFHFLSRSNASRAIAIAGYEAGVRSEARSKAQYKLHGLPSHVEHSHAINEFYLELLEASRKKGSDVRVSIWDLWGESMPGSPLRGAKRDEKVYPDGTFEVGLGNHTCRCLVEYESRSRRGEALRKLDGYGAHLHRMFKEEPNSVEEWLRPVIFLYPRNETTVNVNRVLLGALIAEAPELSRFRAWQKAALGRGVHARRLVLLGSMEDIGRRGALDTRFGVLETYPDGAPVADFRAVAGEVSDSVERAGVKGR